MYVCIYIYIYIYEYYYIRVPRSKRLHSFFYHSHPNISNRKRDWTVVKYLNVLHHNSTQKAVVMLLPDHFHQKQ